MNGRQGEGLNGIATYYGVKPEDIINYPANNLDPAAIGDSANPNYSAGDLAGCPRWSPRVHLLERASGCDT